MKHIRKNVFGIYQAEMAEIAKTKQSIVSRWENSNPEKRMTPNLKHLTLIRNEAINRGLSWCDSHFFVTPTGEEK